MNILPISNINYKNNFMENKKTNFKAKVMVLGSMSSVAKDTEKFSNLVNRFNKWLFSNESKDGFVFLGKNYGSKSVLVKEGEDFIEKEANVEMGFSGQSTGCLYNEADSEENILTGLIQSFKQIQQQLEKVEQQKQNERIDKIKKAKKIRKKKAN